MFEYVAMPTDVHAWRNRHRDAPCMFRKSLAYLFTTAQCNEIDALFPKGWKTDAGHVLLSCEGTLSVTRMETSRSIARLGAAYYPVHYCSV